MTKGRIRKGPALGARRTVNPKTNGRRREQVVGRTALALVVMVVAAAAAVVVVVAAAAAAVAAAVGGAAVADEGEARAGDRRLPNSFKHGIHLCPCNASRTTPIIKRYIIKRYL